MRNNNTPQNQQGIVSIVVTLILMLVITMIVLSFAKISQREQRSALDRQLSTQAFYAAESGVNDAVNAIRNWLPGDGRFRTNRMTNCDGGGSFANDNGITLPTSLSGLNNAAYTCIFVDPTPELIRYAKSDTTHIFPLESATAGQNLTDIELHWDDGETAIVGGCLTAPLAFDVPANNPDPWYPLCQAPVLRVELVNADDLSTSKVFFVYPSTGGSGSLDFASSPTGSIMYGQCDETYTPQLCRATIGLTAPPGLNADKYFVRVGTVYEGAEIDIEGEVAGTPVELIGAQAIVDVTGVATDVARRIQVRVKANDLGGNVPLYGVVGTDKVCKQFSLTGASASDDGSCSTSGPFPD